jgi:pimeloyl-ACP methyl ester carboxylesterase
MFTAARGVMLALTVAGLAACSHNAGPREGLRRIAGPAGTLVVDDGGHGSVPVVFVHSYAGSKAHWSHALAHLRKSRRAIAFDVRGHGQSSPPAGNVYAPDALAADIGAVVDALALDRFVLVGHSMGSSAAIAYAAAHPQRVAGLLLLGAPAEVPPEQARKIVAAIEADYDKSMTSFWDGLCPARGPTCARG